MSPGGINLKASGNFSGTIQRSASGGTVDLSGASLPNATVIMDILRSNASSATLGDVTMVPAPAGLVSAGPSGVLHTKSFVMQGGSLAVFVDSAGSSRIDATGSVTVAGGVGLLVSGSPALGQTFTIISNDGTDPVNGTFDGLPEGAIMAKGSSRFRFSYRGG